MATKKYLDLDGLTHYDTKIKSVIPTKTSDLTNDGENGDYYASTIYAGTYIDYDYSNNEATIYDINNSTEPLYLASKDDIPTSTSDLINDSGFITDSKVVVINYGDSISFRTIETYVQGNYVVICRYVENAQSMDPYNTKYLTLTNQQGMSKGSRTFIFSGFINSSGKYRVITFLENQTSEANGIWSYTDIDLQEELVSGTNIKTINNTSLLGSGNISISGGSATDVQINGTSIVSSDVANIITESAYNSSTNKIATMSDVPVFITTDETVCSGITLAPSTNTSVTSKSITKSGYKPLGLMGYSMTGTNHQSVNIIILDLTASNNGSGTIQYRFRNLSTGTANATITLTTKVLWLKV